MATILIECQIKVVDDEFIKQLFRKTIETGNDLIEIPEMPGVCFNKIIGVSKGEEPLDLRGLKDRISVAMYGDAPTKVILMKKS